jgi:hypothetical protein
MSESSDVLRIHIIEGSDPTRAERDARSLREDLLGLGGTEVAFADELPTRPGAKGLGLSPEIVLVVTIGVRHAAHCRRRDSCLGGAFGAAQRSAELRGR